MVLTNKLIIEYTEKLNKIINNNDLIFPAYVLYIIQKNFNNLFEIYKELIGVQIDIIKNYGIESEEEGKYHFENETNLKKAEKELNEFYALSQDVNILKFKIDSIESVQLNFKQMDALMFMID